SSAREIDTPDLARAVFTKPDVSIRTQRDAFRLTRSRGNRDLGHDSAGGHLADLVDGLFGEPEVAVRTRRDVVSARGRCRDRELVGDDARRRDAADLVGRFFGEP